MDEKQPELTPEYLRCIIESKLEAQEKRRQAIAGAAAEVISQAIEIQSDES